jgi:hypothetical protein
VVARTARPRPEARVVAPGSGVVSEGMSAGFLFVVM